MILKKIKTKMNICLTAFVYMIKSFLCYFKYNLLNNNYFLNLGGKHNEDAFLNRTKNFFEFNFEIMKEIKNSYFIQVRNTFANFI